MSQPYAEAMAVHMDVQYKPYDTSFRGKYGGIITFAQFEQGNILTKTRENAESGNESDDNSVMPPLIGEE